MFFEIEERGARGSAVHMRAMGVKAKHMKPAFEEIADLVIGRERSKWRNNRWQLADSTLARKRRQGLPATPLVGARGGTLRRVLTVRDPSAKAKGLLLDISDERLAFGIKGGRVPIYYGRILQKGARNRRRGGTLPPRGVVVKLTSPKVKEQMNSIVLEHLLTESLKNPRGV